MNFDLGQLPRFAALAILAAAVYRLWMSHYLEKWRYRELVVLLIILGVGAAWQFLGDGMALVPASMFTAVLNSFISATAGVFGYEALTNLMGEFGVGPVKRGRAANPSVVQLAITKAVGSDIRAAGRDIRS